MRRSKPGHERKNSRRRSWFSGTNLFSTMFAANSAPPSPAERKSMESLFPLAKQYRSQSLTPLDDATPVTKSSFSTMLSKARRQHKRKESSNSTEQDNFSFIQRRDSAKSEATTVYDTDKTMHGEQRVQQQQQQQPQPQHIQHLLNSDEDEADRIQLKNDLVKLAFEGEFSLPFDYKDLQSARILGVGCGPGSWCIDLSQKYPRLEVIGVDSDDMFPSQHSLPSNCQLLVCNVLNGLREFPEKSFDVIHIRFMVLSFTVDQYPQVVADCWRLLKPGGYIEILETDLTVYSAGPITKRFNEEMLEVASSRGLDPKEQANNLSQLIPIDHLNGQVKYRSIPIGVWGGRIGVLCRDDMINMLIKFQPAIYDYFGKKSNQDEISTVMREVEQYKSFSNYYFYTAQKSELPPLPLACSTTMKRNFTSGSFNPKSF